MPYHVHLENSAIYRKKQHSFDLEMKSDRKKAILTVMFDNNLIFNVQYDIGRRGQKLISTERVTEFKGLTPNVTVYCIEKHQV